MIENTNALSRKEKLDPEVVALFEYVVEALAEWSGEVERALAEEERKEAAETGISSGALGLTALAGASTSFLGASGLVGSLASQVQVFGAVLQTTAHTSDSLAYAQGLTGAQATRKSHATHTYEDLRVALNERKVKAKGRLLTEAEEEEEVEVPFEFYEALIPICGLFVLMLAFFTCLLPCRQHEKVAVVLKEFNANALIRFGLIFYLPLQIACLKAFQELSFTDSQIEEAIQLGGAILVQLLLFALGAVVLIVVVNRGIDFVGRQEGDAHYSTLFYELKKE